MANNEKLFIRMKLMDKAESIIKHAITLGAVVWSVSIIADRIERVAYTLIAFVVAIIALTIYNVKQNKLSNKKVEQMSARIVKLEKQIDRNRTSSKLTNPDKSTRQTNPLDE